MFSAQLVTQSRWCAAQYCPHDAEPSGLCVLHERLRGAGVQIVLHQVEQPAPSDEPVLPCAVCKQWKPDDDFCHKKGKPHRRNRNSECRACQSHRRRAQSTTCIATTTTPDNNRQTGRPCRAYAVPGTAYCASHGGHP